MTLLESDFDTFAFERAFIGGTEAEPRPVAVVSGVECSIETEPGALGHGIAMCQPLSPHLAEDWPVNVLTEENGIQSRHYAMTAEAAIVAAARRFQDLFFAGQARPGMAL